MIETIDDYKYVLRKILDGNHSRIQHSDAIKHVLEFEIMIANAIDDCYLENHASKAFREEIAALRNFK